MFNNNVLVIVYRFDFTSEETRSRLTTVKHLLNEL